MLFDTNVLACAANKDSALYLRGSQWRAKARRDPSPAVPTARTVRARMSSRGRRRWVGELWQANSQRSRSQVAPTCGCSRDAATSNLRPFRRLRDFEHAGGHGLRSDLRAAPAAMPVPTPTRLALCSLESDDSPRQAETRADAVQTPQRKGFGLRYSRALSRTSTTRFAKTCSSRSI